jgi:hypothetical protein
MVLKIYGTEEKTKLLDEVARFSFQIIQDSMLRDMTMAICRLSDPVQSRPKTRPDEKNLSLAYLVSICPEIGGLETLLQEFKTECEPIQAFRNKQVGHKDLETAIKPLKHTLPGWNKKRIDRIMKLASDILNAVSAYYEVGPRNFHPITLSGADTLLYWLQAAKKAQSNTRSIEL